MKDMPNLDLLRSIAVMLVIVSHILLGMGWVTLSIFGWTIDLGNTGQLGVVIFFVHTCLVLMWSLERNSDPMGFYVRRAFRIYPLSMLVVLVIVCFHIPVSIAGNEVHFTHLVSWWQLPANLFLVQNIFLFPNVMGPLWTLPLEIQMYILLPFLFYFVVRNKSLWPLFLIWGLIVTLNRYQNYGLNYIVTMIPLFLPGVMAYVGFKRVRAKFSGWFLPIVLTAMALFLLHRANIYRMYVFALLLGLMLPYFKQIGSASLNRLSFTIAKYSYGAYLAHPFAILVGIDMLASHSHFTQLGVLTAILILTVVPAYHWIEEPMIRVGHKLANRIARQHHIPVST